MIDVVEPHHADRLPRERELERPAVQVRELLRGEQREAPASRDDCGDVVRHVVVHLHGHSIADPDARYDVRRTQQL